MTVIKEVSSKKRTNGSNRRYFLMKCICGKKHISSLESFKYGKTISCGCIRKNRFMSMIIGRNMSKENSPRWIKDRTKLSRYIYGKERVSPAYKNWRKEVIKRDNLKCKIGNKDCCGQLETHHILGWRKYPELRYDINNGITLCHFHHPLKREEEKKLSPYFKDLIKQK